MTKQREDEKYMAVALKLAGEAADEGEIPVGAVVVKNGEIIGTGKNSREATGSPTAHAEIAAIEAAAKALGDWRLTDCTLYVTLEPCAMCAGAVINARLERVVYAAADEAAGCMGSRINLAHLELGKAPKVTAGVLAQRAAALLTDFFNERRK